MLGATSRLVKKMLDIGVCASIGRVARRHYGRGCTCLTGEVDRAVLLHAACPEDQIWMRIEIIIGTDRNPARFSL
jgi:hypothetical protein